MTSITQKLGRSEESDECITPAYVVEPIVKHLRDKGYNKIYCPFDLANSQYVRVLTKAGFKVAYSHKDTGNDFFTSASVEKALAWCDCVVSNPPFSKKDKVLARLYESGKPFAVLLPVASLQGHRRVKLFIKYGVEILAFAERACFYTNDNYKEIKGSPAFGSAYFCRNVLPSPLMFSHLEFRQEPYEEDLC